MDPASTRLAMRLHLEDIETILKRNKENADSRANDEVVAFQALRAEIVKKWTEVNGKCAAMAILREENANRAIFTRLLSEEKQAEDDHDLACRLAGLGPPVRADRSLKRGIEEVEDLKSEAVNGKLDEVKRVRFSIEECPLTGKLPHEPTNQSKPSSSGFLTDGKGKGKVGMDIHVECSSCLERHPKFDVLQLTCKGKDNERAHAYCRDCLEGLFEASITDSSLFPPRCCSIPIGLFSCTPFLSKDLFARFVAKREELAEGNPIYCSNTACAQWIKSADITADIATCLSCSQKTCSTCKGKQHEGLCPEDQDVKHLMDVAKEKQWKTCPNCKNMVELNMGCYHIRCRCQHDFCYLCLAKWKTCRCLLWDEENIVDLAPIAVEAPNPPLVPDLLPQVPNPPLPTVPVIRPTATELGAPARVASSSSPLFRAAHPITTPVPAQAGRLPLQPGSRRWHQRIRNHRGQHNFSRVYRSKGEDTICNKCGLEDRYAEVCSRCPLKVCWFCFRHRV